MTMQNGWTEREGRVEGGMKTSVRTCAVSTVMFADSERERGWSFCEPTEEKIKVRGRMLDAIQQSGSPFLF